MEKENARKQTLEQLHERRKQVVRLHQKAIKIMQIVAMTGLSYPAVRATLDRFAEGGWSAIRPSARGRARGDGRCLSAVQEEAIRRTIIDKRPEQLKMDFFLWSRAAVSQLIEQEYCIKLQVRSVGKYLARWGFTPQKPIRRAYEQSPAAVQAWLEGEYPGIAERARQEGAEIHWGDETGIRSDCQHGRSYAPAGKTPVQHMPGSRFATNMISTVTNQGKVRFMLYRETMTAPVLIRFLARLVRDAGRKVFLILDNLRVHHSNKVRDWLKKHAEHIEIFFLPAYSPELNPDEYLNCDLKALVHGGKPARNRDQLESKVRGAMMKIQNRPKRVMSYFQHRKIQYAA